MSRHTLPPKWDGHPVAWSGWIDTSDIIICPPPKQAPCPGCGKYTQPQLNEGRLLPFSRPIRSLMLYRCMACGHTEVDELADGAYVRSWVLDDSDYGDQGSTYLQQGTLDI